MLTPYNMKRKLVKMGQHTLMSAIPSTWIQKHHLQPGDQVEFTEVENKLVLTSTAEIYERKATIDIPSPTIMVVWRSLQPAYTSGYDEVKVTFHQQQALEHIQFSIQHLIGWEIVETGKSHVLIKSISKQLDEEFETILRRTFLVLKQMTYTAGEAFRQRSGQKLAEIKPLELTINKYTMFLKRIINRTGYKYPHYMYLLVSFLELASNHLEYIRKYFLELEPKAILGKEISREFKKVEEYVEKVYDFYYNYSPEKFVYLAEALPHFTWFTMIKNSEVRSDLKMFVEYLVQVARMVKGLHT